MAGWITKPLKSVTSKIGSGATPRGGRESYKENGVALIRSMNVHDHRFKLDNLAFLDDEQAEGLSNVEVLENDVLLNITGASIARCCIYPSKLGPARVNQHVAIIRPETVVIDPVFLTYLLQAPQYKNSLLETGDKAGSTRQALTKGQLEKFQITFPSSVIEQKRIVAILDQAFEGIDKAIANTEQNLKNARELFESELANTFNEKEKKWKKTRLAEIGRAQTGSTPKTSAKDNFGTYIPFVKPADFMPDGSLTIRSDGLSEKGLQKSRLIKAGSVLMVCIGATIGKTAYTSSDISANQQINALTPEKGVSGKFLYYQMLTKKVQAEVIKNSGQATLPIINKTKWGNLRMLIPESLKEQEQIVEQLDGLRAHQKNLQGLYKEKLLKLAILKQSLLQKAFSGELTAAATEEAVKVA